MLELRHRFPLAVLLKAAALARSTFYHREKVLRAPDQHAALKARIQALYERHKGRYGYRRITAALRQAGERINHKRVQRLMGLLKLKSLVRLKRYRSYLGAVGKAAPNVLARQFEAQQPNQKWVTDVTEFTVNNQKLYLSPVLDLYNGEIIAYQLERKPVFDLVRVMMRRALSRLAPHEQPMVHSDQGWHYQMPAYQQMLKRRSLVQSMSRKGNCLDNAAMESFFATLKTEFFYLNKFTSLDELECGLKQYIQYYNHDRIRLKLNGLSPVQYRTQFA